MQDNKRPSNDIESPQHDEKLTPADGAPPVVEHASDVNTMAPISGGSDVTPGSIIIERIQDPALYPGPRPPYPAPLPTTTTYSTKLHSITKMPTVEPGVRADLTYHSASFVFNFISSTAYSPETKPNENTKNPEVPFNEEKVTSFSTDSMGIPSKNDNTAISVEERGKSTASSTKDVQTFKSTKEQFIVKGLADTTARESPAYSEITTHFPVNIPTTVSFDSKTWNRSLLGNSFTVKDSPLSTDVKIQITTSSAMRTTRAASTRVTSETTASNMKTPMINSFAMDTFKAVTENEVTVKPSLKEDTATAATFHKIITGQISSFDNAITTTLAINKNENIKYFASTSQAVTTAFLQLNKSESSSHAPVAHSLKLVPVMFPLCSCGCNHYHQLSMLSTAAMPQHSQAWAMATKRLVVPKHQTAKAIRQKASARDARTSSAMMGIFGIVSCMAAIFPIFFCDLLRLSHFLTRKDGLSGCSRHH